MGPTRTLTGDTTCRQPTTASAAEGGARLSYGVAEDGRMRHVSEVANGLACGLRCAGCGARLVARHPHEEIVAHLAHHAVNACPGAGETTLHRLAKEIILEARSILLPKAIAAVSGATKEVFAALEWRYETARQEVVLPGLIPDVIVTGGGRELHVEVRVTHACGPEKLARLRERGLSSLEIDLSRVPRMASREEHTEAVLSSATRKWLNNLKVAAAEEQLLADVARKTDEAAARRRRVHALVAREVTAAWDEPPVDGPASWVQQAEDAGYGSLVGIPVIGDRCFQVTSEIWQSALIKHAVLDLAGNRVAANGTLKRLQDFRMLKEPFMVQRDWNAEIVSCVRESLPDFGSPCEAIEEYVAVLVEHGALVRLAGGTWSAPAEAGPIARSRIAMAEGRRARARELDEKLEPIRRALGPDDTSTLTAWMSATLPGSRRSPAELIASGGRDWTDFLGHLEPLKQMLSPGGWALPEESFLGLPLASHADARRREAADRLAEAEIRLTERRRKEAASFLDELERNATKHLGQEAGTAWMLQAVGHLTQAEREDGRLAPHARFREQVEADLWTKCSALMAVRQRQEREREALRLADATAASCRAELEERARRHFADPDKAAAWLRGRQHRWAISPWEFCTDRSKLEECRKLLEAPPARRRR